MSAPNPLEAHAGERAFGLDLLRAAAICLVLVAHTWPFELGRPWSGACGVLGVELFFVLSGFLIGGILLREYDSGRLQRVRGLWHFWIRRWFRTLPNYYLFLALHMAWRQWWMGYPVVALTHWEYFFFLQNLFHPPPYFFPETWSLSIEEYFYLSFPLTLFLALRVLRQSRWAWIGTVGVFLVVPTVLRAQTALANDLGYSSAFFWCDTVRKTVFLRLDCVMYGVLMAMLCRWRKTLWQRLRPSWWIGMGMVIFSGTSVAAQFPLSLNHGWQALLLWPMMSVGISLLLPALHSMAPRRGLVPGAIRWTAKLSYSLYLCHMLVILGLKDIARRLPSWQGELQPPWYLAAWVLSFVVAYLTYTRFEKPVMDWRERFS